MFESSMSSTLNSHLGRSTTSSDTGSPLTAKDCPSIHPLQACDIETLLSFDIDLPSSSENNYATRHRIPADITRSIIRSFVLYARFVATALSFHLRFTCIQGWFALTHASTEHSHLALEVMGFNFPFPPRSSWGHRYKPSQPPGRLRLERPPGNSGSTRSVVGYSKGRAGRAPTRREGGTSDPLVVIESLGGDLLISNCLGKRARISLDDPP